MSAQEIPRVRSIGLVGLTMTGISSIIGSGWLFSSYYTAKLAGPAAIFCWLIGGFAATMIALAVCELSSMMPPKAGGMARFMNYSHGTLAGFLSAWANWLGTVAVIPIEAVASIQYMSSWKAAWAQNLYDPVTNNMTTTGLIASVLLIFMYFFINYWSIKLFMRFVYVITVLKVAVPVLTVIGLMYSGFHPDNFTSVNNSLVPYGWSTVLSAVITCGIIMSFNGFQSPVNLIEEIKHPYLLPLGLMLAIFITLAIYLLLQVAFIGAISPDMLAQVGWHGISFKSPFVQLALAVQLNFIVLLLYFDSLSSPTGTGIIYMATTTRMLYGMQRSKYMPSFLGYLDPVHHTPRYALITNLVLSLIFLWFYRGWAHLVPIISIAHLISYIPCPISLGGLRHLAPHLPRRFKLPFANLIAPFAFLIISSLVYWSRWPLTGEMAGCLLASLSIYFYYQYQQGWPHFKEEVNGAAWLLVYLLGIATLSYYGSKNFGGIGLLDTMTTHIILVIFTLLIYHWAVRSAWITTENPNYVAASINFP